jgi:hypothetical protein
VSKADSSTRKLHFKLHTHRTLGVEQLDPKEKAPRGALLQSPLSDSNRRPPPYHGTTQASVRNPRQRISLA